MTTTAIPAADAGLLTFEPAAVDLKQFDAEWQKQLGLKVRLAAAVITRTQEELTKASKPSPTR